MKNQTNSKTKKLIRVLIILVILTLLILLVKRMELIAIYWIIFEINTFYMLLILMNKKYSSSINRVLKIILIISFGGLAVLIPFMAIEAWPNLYWVKAAAF